MRHFIHLAYKGTAYRGWQRQLNVPSVQQTLEEKIEQLLRRDVFVHGCGRTDAGVHASQFYAHIDMNAEEAAKLRRLNLVLPEDIIIKEIFQVEDRTSAQLDAVSRTYQYNIHFEKNPFIGHTSSLYGRWDYDLDLMKQGFEKIGEASDFYQFCKTVNNYRTTDCKIFDLAFDSDKKAKTLKLTIKANRFLRGMIRYLVSDVLAIGSRDLEICDWVASLQNEKERNNKLAAHPQGLHLIGVSYDTKVKDIV